MTPRTSHRSVLRQQAVFEGRGTCKAQGLYRGGEIRVFVSPRAYMKTTVRRVTSRQQAVFVRGRETEMLFLISRIKWEASHSSYSTLSTHIRTLTQIHLQAHHMLGW